MPLPIQADTLRSEVDQILNILTSWKERLSEGIPGDEMPATGDREDLFQFHLRRELLLCAERLNALCEVLEP